MANLDPLIRLQKFALDEKRRQIARLYADADRVLLQKNTMLDTLQSERTFASESYDQHVITLFLSFQGLMKKKLALNDQELARIEARINTATDDLREQFAELKRFEITQKRRLEQKKERLRRRETALFDEIALNGFLRQNAEGEA